MNSAPGIRFKTLAALLLSVGACDSPRSAHRSENDPTADAPARHSGPLSTSTPMTAAETRPALCERVCAHTAPLACSEQAECAASCAEMHRSVQTCKPKLEVFLRCLVSRPLTDFECDDDGIASIKDGPCDLEQGAVAQCLVSTAAEG